MKQQGGQQTCPQIVEHDPDPPGGPFKEGDRGGLQDIKDTKKHKGQPASPPGVGSCQKGHSLPQPLVDHHD